MAADADIFPHDHASRLSVVGSLALHSALFALALFGYLIPSGRGESWGGTEGGGGAMSATLVSSIPLPNAQPEAQNVLANESKGLSQSRPKETPKEEPKAIPIPSARRQAEGPARVRDSPKKEPPKQVAKAEPDNQIPYGQGWPGQRSLRIVHLRRHQGRIRIPGRPGRLRQSLRLLRRHRAPQSVGQLAEVRSRSADLRRAPRLHLFRDQSVGPADEYSRRAVERNPVARSIGSARFAAHRHVRTAARGILGQLRCCGVLV